MVAFQAIHTRTVRDVTGTVWRVTESSVLDVPGAMASECLVFESVAVCRRYWRYPADWRTLPDDRLLGFMDQPRPTFD